MEDAFKVFLQNGLSGAFIVLLVFALITVYKALQTVQDQRIKELIAFKETIDENTRSNRSQADGNRQVAEAVRQLSERLERIRDRSRHGSDHG